MLVFAFIRLMTPACLSAYFAADCQIPIDLALDFSPRLHNHSLRSTGHGIKASRIQIVPARFKPFQYPSFAIFRDSAQSNSLT